MLGFGAPRADSVQEAAQPAPALPAELRAFVSAVSTAADERDRGYLDAAAGLRGRAELAARAGELEAHADLEAAHALRQALVLAIGAVGGDAAVRTLAGIVAREPSSRRDEPAELSSRVAHETVRTTAVDQLAALARDGEHSAMDALVETMRVESRAVRAVALASLHGLDGGRFERARAMLPAGQASLGDVRHADVRTVPQPDPRRRLVNPRAGGPTAKPEDEGRRPAHGQQISGRAPRLAKERQDG